MFARPRDLVDAFARALNSKDAVELGELFSDDGEFVNIMGMRMRHREGIVDGHRWAFDGPLAGGASTLTRSTNSVSPTT